MPRLACWTCGRQLYTVVPLESLLHQERRCPRCGAPLNADRREKQRREAAEREDPQDDPGPPGGEERRIAERRQIGRRDPGEG